jgi:hypothetical protein
MYPRKPVGHQGRHQHRAKGGKTGYNKRIDVKRCKGSGTVIPPAPDIILQGSIFGDQGNGAENFFRRLEGTENHPEQRIEHKKTDKKRQPMEDKRIPYSR